MKRKEKGREGRREPGKSSSQKTVKAPTKCDRRGREQLTSVSLAVPPLMKTGGLYMLSMLLLKWNGTSYREAV